MVVGITRVSLALPGNDSLKGKRSVVKKLLERVRSRFHISAAEVDAQDSLQRAVLGFATVGSDGRKVATVLERMVDFIDDAGLAQVVAVEQETVNYGDDALGEDVWGSYAEKFGADETWPPAGVMPALDAGPAGDADARDATDADAIATDAGELADARDGAGSGHRVRIRPGSLGFGSRKAVDIPAPGDAATDEDEEDS